MVEAKASRIKKRQLGQYMTPQELADQVLAEAKIDWSKSGRYLEPSFGEGSFLVAMIEELIDYYGNRDQSTLDYIFSNQIFGVELDPQLYSGTIKRLESAYGKIKKHNLVNEDFFLVPFLNNHFDLIAGNPPFGGTFNPDIEDQLDRKFGSWKSHKLKKETYSFFIAASLEMLVEGGRLLFLSSDTFLTINTMAGLRHRLLDQATCEIRHLQYFSDETDQTVLVIDATRSLSTDSIFLDGKEVHRRQMQLTGNFSWKIDDRFAKYFTGATVGDYVVCTSGMTIGDNKMFVREIVDGHIIEPSEFIFFEEKITLRRELERARLNKLSKQMEAKFRDIEASGQTRRNVKVMPLNIPIRVSIPNEDYLPYNKAMSGIIYRPPKFVVYWKNDGDAVLTFKRNGSWYLHGVGGGKFFGRAGLTWSLVSSTINMKILDEGQILDSGAPCAFLRDGVPEEELWFIFGWCLSDLATDILKGVINHTRNIQGKDVERLPYPSWISDSVKKGVVKRMKELVAEARGGREFKRSDPELVELSKKFEI